MSVLTAGSQAKYRNANAPHFVYQFWGRKGECLYIGCTVQPAGRISAHAKNLWWWQVDRIVADVHPDRETGRMAEAELINLHQPLHNWYHTDKAVGSRR